MTADGTSPPPLAIGIALAPAFERRGESLADARAYEAAGCDSLWLLGAEDPWLAAAALAAVTARVRLVVPATPEDLAEGSFGRRAATLLRLLPGRLAVLCATTELVGAVRAAARCPVYGPAGADAVVLDAGQPVFGSPTWLRCGPPAERAAWRELRERCRNAGAAGLVVRESPGLLDLLRNPDRDDDRSDLTLAHG